MLLVRFRFSGAVFFRMAHLTMHVTCLWVSILLNPVRAAHVIITPSSWKNVALPQVGNCSIAHALWLYTLGLYWQPSFTLSEIRRFYYLTARSNMANKFNVVWIIVYRIRLYCSHSYIVLHLSSLRSNCKKVTIEFDEEVVTVRSTVTEQYNVHAVGFR